MEFKYKAGDKVRVLDVESLSMERSKWIGKELTLKKQDIGGTGWDFPAWSVVEPECGYRFRESELGPWVDSPIRTETVTTRRIEPGVYGRLELSECVSSDPRVPVVGLEFVARDGERHPKAALNSPELRELARVALELAEYLDAQ